ncbi:uncharacterized protein isoform X1 [Takifugu rubripes]|uniref:Zgc:100829 n=1 Tax=Takifugu rubripes TaxID=31033 RepID=A0A674N654_TAKRU|nr:uncharacterized protein LOC115252797 isoform X1 [Takifugu rubripes]XP_029704831.1 uncharacterized protein LOC115252797 isoform X1 [Takifugu rubripes]XP_029704832.1 uncharacterized protein LOC115252797 isoform X1 [Takifugu rubripes]XP_029704833.1 uncharacterized protein LOC115252797 isoform X1 [Takifugu rubripes]
MLQQILQDMYIDPDVLDALNEDQKKTLFLKMRQEQVRRWREREEKLEGEGGDGEHKRTKPKKANSKTVSWLLGRDGDVAVVVIGDVDELTSKFICSGLGEKKAPNLPHSTKSQTILKSRKCSEPAANEKEPPPNAPKGISLHLKQGGGEEAGAVRPLPVSVSDRPAAPAPAPAPAAEESESTGATETKSVPPSSVCSKPPVRATPVTVRPASAAVAPGSVNSRPGFSSRMLASTPAPASSNSALKQGSGTTADARSGPGAQEPQKPQEAAVTRTGRGVAGAEAPWKAASQDAGPAGGAPACAGRGRVAQLMKTFNAESGAAQAPTRVPKPPLPSKPSHLRITATPTVR